MVLSLSSKLSSILKRKKQIKILSKIYRIVSQSDSTLAYHQTRRRPVCFSWCQLLEPNLAKDLHNDKKCKNQQLIQDTPQNSLIHVKWESHQKCVLTALTTKLTVTFRPSGTDTCSTILEKSHSLSSWAATSHCPPYCVY